MAINKKIDQDVLAVLSRGIIFGNIFKMTCGKLDRKMYLSVNEVLENMGGKWNRKEGGHIFDTDPTDKIEQTLLTGETINEKQLLQFFETPQELAADMVYRAEIKPGQILLEPSAGNGAILKIFPKNHEIVVIEINQKCADVLRKDGFNVKVMNFLEYNEKRFDRIIMNPPFTKQQDIDHVLHAYDLLKNGGKVVAIMSVGFTFRENKKSVNFRELVERCGEYEHLDRETFKNSGALVNTVLVILDKTN